MTHDHADGTSAACPACAKKVINNYAFITNLATHIRGSEANALWSAARTYRDILASFGITPSRDGFEGCDQAQLLVKWIRGEQPDFDLMKKWTEEIWVAIAELADGKLPQ